MEINEIFQYVLDQSGQFIISPDNIELNVNRFVSLTKLALSTYSRYNPHIVHLFKSLEGDRQYEFTEANTPEGIPDNISDIIPARVSGLPPFFLRNPDSDVEIKTQFPWKYRKPVLTVPVDAKYDITAVYNHRLKKETDSYGKTLWTVDTINIEEDEVFFDLLTGRFLRGLGSSRRAFTMDDLPITTDSADLVSDGKDMEERALEALKNEKHAFYLAWR